MKNKNNKNEKDATTRVMPVAEGGEQSKRRRRSPDSAIEREETNAVTAENQALFESISSYRKETMTPDQYWERIFYVHLKTKELYILAEEYGSELKTFYLPINSLKDAYENIIHICANDYMARTGNSPSNSSYVMDNLRAALGNECKAFFDTADFLSILLRKKINERLSGFTYPQIASVWDEYNDVRMELIRVNQEIADIRNKKSDSNDYYIDEDVESYYNETKKLMQWYVYVEEKIYPKLEQRFNDF